MNQSSQVDIKKLVLPGQEIEVQSAGQFVFYKSGAASLSVIINDQPVEMEPGDVRRVDSFSSFIIKNNQDYEQFVTLVAGIGDYNRLIVRGNVSTKKGIWGVDNVLRVDTRRVLVLQLGILLIDTEEDRRGEWGRGSVMPDNFVSQDNIVSSQPECIFKRYRENANEQFLDRFSGAIRANLIRLVLDGYVQAMAFDNTKFAEDNYLDHVYGLKIDGRIIYPVSDESLARQRVIDLFYGSLGSYIELVVDKEIESLGAFQ